MLYSIETKKKMETLVSKLGITVKEIEAYVWEYLSDTSLDMSFDDAFKVLFPTK